MLGAARGLTAPCTATSCEAIIISNFSFGKKKKLYWGPATLACYTGFFCKSTQEKLRGWALVQDMVPTFPLGPSTAHTKCWSLRVRTAPGPLVFSL